MKAHGRHIMINCVGEGDEPPVSVTGFAVYLAHYLREHHLFVDPKEVLAAIRSYESGER